MSKEELFNAHRHHEGNEVLFQDLDADRDERVTLGEWLVFLNRTRETRGEEGIKWFQGDLGFCVSHLPPSALTALHCD